MRLVVLFLFIFFTGQSKAQNENRIQTGICIPEETKKLVLDNIANNKQKHGGGDLGIMSSIPIKYPFYPQGGTLYRDLTTGNFVDLNPNHGVVTNYLCEHYGNDGHEGIDTGGVTWEEMAIGQPIFAVLDGTVIDARDGDPDMNTSCEAGGNWVIIDHGSGRNTWYFHLKRGSVAVGIGQQVRAGQQIGLVGSSGCSFGPHLHFQSMQDGIPYEPFSGACRSGESGWKQQIDPPPIGAFVRDMGVTIQDIGSAAPLPYRAPADNQIPISAGGYIYYWIQFGNLPPNSTWKERYIRPNGQIEYELGPFNFGNPTNYQFSQYWFYRYVYGMSNTPGTWRIQFEVNNRLLVDAPVEVVTTVSSTFNRAPLPISVSFDPQFVVPGQTVFARVSAPSNGYRDLDWQIVRYRYQWKLNNVTVRDVISVGMADALPGHLLKHRDRLSVTVTAGDGFGGGLGATAAPVTVSTVVRLPQVAF